MVFGAAWVLVVVCSVVLALAAGFAGVLTFVVGCLWISGFWCFLVL